MQGARGAQRSQGAQGGQAQGTQQANGYAKNPTSNPKDGNRMSDVQHYEHPKFDYNRDYEYPLGRPTANSAIATGKVIAPTANASNSTRRGAPQDEQEGADQDPEEQLKRFRGKHAYKETFREEPTYEPTFQDGFMLSVEAGFHYLRDSDAREATWKGLGW